MRRRKKYLLLFIACVSCLKNILLLPVWLVLAVVYKVNSIARRRSIEQVSAFWSRSEIRNADVLIIGDMINPDMIISAGESYVQICAPHRGIASCYEILRHTHSILKEEGARIVIAVKKDRKGFSVFDVPFFHSITIKKYGLEKLEERKNPILSDPSGTVLMALGIKSRKYHEAECPSQEIKDFCAERGYSLTFYSS